MLDKKSFIQSSQYYGFWCPSEAARTHNISSHAIDLIIQNIQGSAPESKVKLLQGCQPLKYYFHILLKKFPYFE